MGNLGGRTRQQKSSPSVDGLNIAIFEKLDLSGDGWILFFRITGGENLYRVARDLGMSPEQAESTLDSIRSQLGVYTSEEFRKKVFL